MSRPQNNGLVEFMDDKPDMDGSSWNCMDFWIFSRDEEDKSWEASHARFLQAKAGECPYRDKCRRYARTMARRKREPIQLTLW